MEWAGRSATVAPENVQLQPDPCPEKEIFPDLAIVQVPWQDHACVWLHPDVRLTDDLYTYGYPATNREGDSVTARSEGPTKYGQTNAQELLKFKEGQIRPGISGSPLLNLRTGGVCGVVKRTRGESTDLGGFAVRLSTVLDCFPNLARGQKETQEWNRARLANKSASEAAVHGETTVSVDRRRLKFVSRLPRASKWQDREEFFDLCDWWNSTRSGVCALIGIGGAGKTAIIEQFLQVVPGITEQAFTVSKDWSLVSISDIGGGCLYSPFLIIKIAIFFSMKCTTGCVRIMDWKSRSIL